MPVEVGVVLCAQHRLGLECQPRYGVQRSRGHHWLNTALPRVQLEALPCCVHLHSHTALHFVNVNLAAFPWITYSVAIFSKNISIASQQRQCRIAGPGTCGMPWAE